MQAGTEYAYAVKAVNTVGLSEQSGLAVITTLAESCSVGSYNPTPTAVAVTAVPIVVESTVDDYFALYVRHDLDADTTVEWPVSVTLGEAGTTTLAENIKALPAERYRVEKYRIDEPADVDGDCIDDITELAGLGRMNPVNPTGFVDLNDGAVVIPDRETYESISRAPRRTYIKFVLVGLDTDRPSVYFMNVNTHDHHAEFLDAVGVDRYQSGMHRGQMSYYRGVGGTGIYAASLKFYSPPRTFSIVTRAYTVLAASMPLIEGDMGYYMINAHLQEFQPELPLFWESRINLLLQNDIYGNTSFLSLNTAKGYGVLRVMDPDERPNPRDVVLYETLPNELPRVAGIISAVPQTPLSHVNLRAVQDGIPNAYIRGALDDPLITNLIGSHVRYQVTEGGWRLRAATREEVDTHYASSRPAEEQTPERDLSVTEITPLGDIGFDDWTAFGVKAANVAVLGTLGFTLGTIPDGGAVPIGGTVPDGFAVPFSFYHRFMTESGLNARIETMLADPDFQNDFEIQEDELKDLRKAIKKADTPDWMTEALEAMHAEFPEGTSLRYRSSTNNEDLPGFNGAGLYDSKTQDPEETEEDGIAKSIKAVYASLWNFIAFTERDFHRINHLAAEMGVLVHPNYSDELANGVAVSFDPIYGKNGSYYVNTQIGEDLVTNPDAYSAPEEILLHPDGIPYTPFPPILSRLDGPYSLLAISNQVQPGQLLMNGRQRRQLHSHLTVIHDHFAQLYNPAPGERFAMEIEFKITSDNILAIKQARPWVFDHASTRQLPASGITLDKTVLTVTEGGNATYTVALASRPTAAVTVTITGHSGTGVSLDRTSLSFTTSNWNTPQTVTVSAAQDSDGFNDSATLTHRSSGATEHKASLFVKVADVSSATGAPTITGTAQVGETLTCGHLRHRRPRRAGQRDLQLPVGFQ